MRLSCRVYVGNWGMGTGNRTSCEWCGLWGGSYRVAVGQSVRE